MEHRTAIRMLDGSVRYGTIKVKDGEGIANFVSGQIITGAKQLYFHSTDGEQQGLVDMSSIQAIYIGDKSEPDLEAIPRFFDSSPIPGSLWVRITLIDGDILEGMIANSWCALTAAVLEGHLPSTVAGYRKVLIPRTSIAQLQVITAR